MSNEENVEEGTVILDAKMKEEHEKMQKAAELKTEEMRAVNADITGAIKELNKKHNMKLYVAGYSPKHDEMGIWKSSDVNQFDEMAFCTLLDSQF